MHLLVPFAGSASDAGRQALQSLSLPHLERLLARLSPRPGPGAKLGTDEYSLNPPHDQALAQVWGWSANAGALADGSLPFAARLADALSLPEARNAAWGLLTPVNLQAGREQIRLNNPQDLQLDEAASRALLAIVRPLFESDGYALHWAAPLQWLATHPQFDALPCASLDRVIGRHLDPWLPDQRAARAVRRLQNEVQMLMYTHPVNDQREAAGLPTVNSFWLSGCGKLQAVAAAVADVQVDDRLRSPALAEDWAAWCDAWRALDAGPIQTLLRSGGDAQLTLCGERIALGFDAHDAGLWRRLSSAWRKPDVHSMLEQL